MATIKLGKVCMTPKGTYSGSATYEKLDVVLYNNSSYVCIADTTVTGQAPTNTTYWSPLAVGVKGDKGNAGDSGVSFYGVSSESTLNNFKSAVNAISGALYGLALVTADFLTYKQGDIIRYSTATNTVTVLFNVNGQDAADPVDYAEEEEMAPITSNAVFKSFFYYPIVETTLSTAALTYSYTVNKSFRHLTALIYVPAIGGSSKGNIEIVLGNYTPGKFVSILDTTKNNVIRISARFEGFWFYDMAFRTTTLTNAIDAFNENLDSTPNMYGTVGRNQMISMFMNTIKIQSNVNLPVGTYIKMWGVQA